MSSSGNDMLSAIATTVRNLEITRYMSAAGYVILTYDHVTTLSDEIELIWKKPLSPVSCFFLFNRYVAPVITLIDLWQFGGLATNVPANFCHHWLIIEGGIQTLCQAIAHLLATLRIRALLGARRWVDWVLIVTGMAYLAGSTLATTSIIIYVAKGYEWSPILHVCFGSSMPPWLVWAWIPGLVFETILFGFLVAKAYQDWRQDLSFPITRLLYRDGFISYMVIASSSLFNTIAWAVLPSSLATLAKTFTFCLVVAMSSRIVLNLRTLRRSADDAFYAPQTDAPFEMGNITQGKPRMTRSGTVPTLLSGAGRRDTFSMAPPTSRVWTTSKTDGWDRSIPEMPPVSISVQVDVHRAIEVDEHQYDSDEKMIV